LKNWKDQYNYRRIKDEHGAVLKNVIMIDGNTVEVGEEVYLAYSQMHRRELYLEQLQEAASPISLEKLAENNVPVDLYMSRHSPSSESIVITKEASEEQKILLSKLPEAIEQLKEDEQELIRALFFDGVPAREYARMQGVSDMAVRKRRDRILAKLKNIFENLVF